MSMLSFSPSYLSDPSGLQASFPAFGAVFAFIAAFFLLVMLLALAIYIYTSLAWMTIAKKTKTRPTWLAWIPIASMYQRSQIAKMHWWPLLLIIAGFIPFIGPFASIVLFGFMITWTWKSFERVGRPGWQALFILVPIIGWIAYLVVLGTAAWGKK